MGVSWRYLKVAIGRSAWAVCFPKLRFRNPRRTQDNWGNICIADTVAINKVMANNTTCKHQKLKRLAEREGFEPSVPVLASTTV